MDGGEHLVASWWRHKSKSFDNRVYYFNKLTGKTQWHPPPEVVAAGKHIEQTTGAQRSSKSKSAVKNLQGHRNKPYSKFTAAGASTTWKKEGASAGGNNESDEKCDVRKKGIPEKTARRQHRSGKTVAEVIAEVETVRKSRPKALKVAEKNSAQHARPPATTVGRKAIAIKHPVRRAPPLPVVSTLPAPSKPIPKKKRNGKKEAQKEEKAATRHQLLVDESAAGSCASVDMVVASPQTPPDKDVADDYFARPLMHEMSQVVSFGSPLGFERSQMASCAEPTPWMQPLVDDTLRHTQAAATSVTSVQSVEGLAAVDAVEMDVDMSAVNEDMFLAELQNHRSRLVAQVSQTSTANISAHSMTDALYIVLDTNVLLSHLQFLRELKEISLVNGCQPVLVLPWMVIQELDSLKDSKKLSQSGQVQVCVGDKARQAINWLHHSLSSNHPRVRGQTLDEVNTDVSYVVENNDDRILQCALFYHRQAHANGGVSVLFSNDRNLCNKAMINGLKAFNRQNLLPGLQGLCNTLQQSQARPTVASSTPQPNVLLEASSAGQMSLQTLPFTHKDHSEGHHTDGHHSNGHHTDGQHTNSHQESVSAHVKLSAENADECYEQSRKQLTGVLSVVVEVEMKAAFDDLWTSMLSRKPPWTLADLLFLLDKHWIAVFGLVLDRQCQQLVQQLQPLATGSSGLDEVKKFLATAKALVHSLTARQTSYKGNAQRCVRVLTSLLDNPPTKETSSLPTESNHQRECVQVFTVIWEAISSMSLQAFSALCYDTTQAALVGSQSEQHQLLSSAVATPAFNFVLKLFSLLSSLLDAIQCLDSLTDLSPERITHFTPLASILQQTAVELQVNDCAVLTPELLYKFSLEEANRNTLVQLHQSIRELLNHLQRCAQLVKLAVGTL